MKPNMKNNPYLNEALAIIDGIYETSQLLCLTGMKKRTWAESYYDTNRKKIRAICNWINKVIIPRLVQENTDPKEEDGIYKRILPYYWKTEWVKEFFCEKIELYNQDEMAGKSVKNYIFYIENFRILFRDLAMVQFPIDITFEDQHGKEKKKRVRLSGKKGLGDINEYYMLSEEHDLVTSPEFSHGRKITKEIALNLIHNWIPKTTAFKQKFKQSEHKEYIKEVQRFLFFQLLTGSRIQAALRISKRDIIWFKKEDYIPFPKPLKGKIVGCLTFFGDKGNLSRTIFLTSEFKKFFYPLWEAIKEDRGFLFNFYRPRENEKEPKQRMNFQETMHMIQKTTNEASKLAKETSEDGPNKDVAIILHKRQKFHVVGEVKREIMDEDGQVKEIVEKKGKRIPLKDENEKTMYEIIEKTQFIKYSINTHSMRKAFADYYYHLFFQLDHKGLDQMLDIHYKYQVVASVVQMKKRLKTQWKRLNADVYERIEENKKIEAYNEKIKEKNKEIAVYNMQFEKIEDGTPVLYSNDQRELYNDNIIKKNKTARHKNEPQCYLVEKQLKPKLYFRDFNHTLKTELLVSMLLGHSRYEITGGCYVDIPQQHIDAGRMETMKITEQKRLEDAKNKI